MSTMLEDIYQLKSEIDSSINKILERDLSLLNLSERSVGLWFMAFGYDRCYKETKEKLFDLDTSRREVEKLITKLKANN